MAPVTFWTQPGAYIHWAARKKPAVFWSICLGALGPVMMVVVPPIRHRLGDYDRNQIPLTYPSEYHLPAEAPQTWTNLRDAHIRRESSHGTHGWYGVGGWADVRTTVPRGPRKIPEGYDD